MTRVRRVSAVLVTLAAVALATTARGEAHAVTDKGSNGGACTHATTRLHLRVTGCNRCTISLQHAVSGNPNVWTSAPQRIGPDETATFSVRTARTQGLSFVLRAPWQGDTGAVPNIVTRYRGHQVDSAIGRTGARHGTHAEGCWAGTTVDRVRLDFHVARVPATTLTGDPTQIPLAYATHTMSSWKPKVKTYNGTIANQDASYCTRPQTTKVTFATPGCTDVTQTWLKPMLHAGNGVIGSQEVLTCRK